MRTGNALGGLLVASILFGNGSVRAQGIGMLPDGVFLDTTPVTTFDRTYVRTSINAGFNTVTGFSTFPVPAAVSGGGVAAFGGGPGLFGGGNGTSGGVVLPNFGRDGGQFGPASASYFGRGQVDYSVGQSSFGSSFNQYMITQSQQNAAPQPIARGKKVVRSRVKRSK